MMHASAVVVSTVSQRQHIAARKICVHESTKDKKKQVHNSVGMNFYKTRKVANKQPNAKFSMRSHIKLQTLTNLKFRLQGGVRFKVADDAIGPKLRKFGMHRHQACCGVRKLYTRSRGCRE